MSKRCVAKIKLYFSERCSTLASSFSLSNDSFQMNFDKNFVRFRQVQLFFASEGNDFVIDASFDLVQFIQCLVQCPACCGGGGRRCVVQVAPVTMSGEYPAVVRGATVGNLDDPGLSL